MANKPISVLSLHYGFSPGGVAQYSRMLESMVEYAPISLSTICILNRKRHVDENTLNELNNVKIIECSSPISFGWVGQLLRDINEISPVVIMSHGFNAHYVAYIAKLLTNDRPCYVATYHGEYHAPTNMKKLVAGIYNGFTHYYMKKSADLVVSVAATGRKFLVQNGVQERKIEVIHNGIPERYDDYINRADFLGVVGVPEDAIVTGVVSRLDKIKGIDYLIMAFQEIVDEFPEAYLVIVGAGPEETFLNNLASKLKIEDKVRFAGYRSDAARIYRAIDIFALPSLSEFHSIGLLEAMRASCAIVATDVGGNTESVRHEKEGLIVDPENVGMLANALKSLYRDKELRESLGRNARTRFIHEFTGEVMARRTAEFIQESADKV